MKDKIYSDVKNKLKEILRNKFSTYTPKDNYMPFHTGLLGKDRLALFSFIHSLNTNFGTTIYEPVARELAKGKFKVSENQVRIGREIYKDSYDYIGNTMRELKAGNIDPNKKKELMELKKTIPDEIDENKIISIKPTKVDLYLEDYEGNIYLFDIKSPKPNKGEFEGFKRTLLEWAGISLLKDSQKNIYTGIAIPYNPFYPEEYNRWTMKGMLDIKEELLVAEGFWDFLGGEGTYDRLLKCFEEVGIEMRDEIDTFFKSFQKK